MTTRPAHVSIDLETLATSPDSVILSIGAVAFDPHLEPPYGDRPVDVFYCNVSIDGQEGRRVSDWTFRFWMRQDRAARDALGTPPPVELHKALEKLDDWWPDRKSPVWSHATFDVPILSHAYGGRQPPWRYTAARDLRTLIENAYGHISDVPRVPRTNVPHHALEDALRQAVVVRRCLIELGEV